MKSKPETEQEMEEMEMEQLEQIIDLGLGYYCPMCGIRACGIPDDEH